MWTTREYELTGLVHHRLEGLWLELCVDADWAGDPEDKYSTNSGVLFLAGPNTKFPLAWVSKKQTACSRSTTESEIIALAYSLFLEAVPMLSLWDRLVGPASGRPMRLKIFEENSAAIMVENDGFSSKLCHIFRTHVVNLMSIKVEVDKPECELLKIDTKRQAADIFTKGVEPQKWDAAIDMLRMERTPLGRKSAEQVQKDAKGSLPAGAPSAQKPDGTTPMRLPLTLTSSRPKKTSSTNGGMMTGMMLSVTPEQGPK